MTTKISWNQYNAMPDDLFWWRGIDGSQVLTYFVNTPGEGQDVSTRYATYNGMVTPHAVLGSWRKFKNKDLANGLNRETNKDKGIGWRAGLGAQYSINDNWDIRIVLNGGFALYGDTLSQIRALPGISKVKEI